MGMSSRTAVQVRCARTAHAGSLKVPGMAHRKKPVYEADDQQFCHQNQIKLCQGYFDHIYILFYILNNFWGG